MGGIPLSIRGENFVTGMSVDMGGSACTPVTVVGPTDLSCLVPERTNETTVNVSLTYPDGTVKVLPNGFTYKKDAFTVSELFSGRHSPAGYRNGVGTQARFFYPTKPVIDGNYMYVSDSQNNVIRRIHLTTKVVEDFVGVKSRIGGFLDGAGESARFNKPMGLVVVGGYLYVADNENCLIRKINLTTRAVSTAAGKISSDCGTAANTRADDPIGLNSVFLMPKVLVQVGTHLYISDDGGILRRMSLNPPHAVDSLISDGVGIEDGPLESGGAGSLGVVMDMLFLNNALYTIEFASVYAVRKIDLSSIPPIVTTIAGGSNSGSLDGIGAAARFRAMGGIATDGTLLYVTDTRNNLLRSINLSSDAVTTIAGTTTPGNVDGIGLAARLNRPVGIVYKDGLLYFASWGSHNIRTYELATGEVKTFAGDL